MSTIEFQQTVKSVKQQIIESLSSRFNINMNKMEGVASWPAMSDAVTPQVTLTREEIRDLAGREKLRTVHIDALEREFLAHPYFTVHRQGDSLTIAMHAQREEKNQFKSFRDLQMKNSMELAEDKTLGEDPY